jgi:hypothetical protein
MNHFRRPVKTFCLLFEQFTEPSDSVFDSGKEHLSNGVDSSPTKLPPKKSFKSKATLKQEAGEDSPAAAPSFKDWLGMKLSPEKSNNQGESFRTSACSCQECL